MYFRYRIMLKKRFDKKGQEASPSYRYLMTILLVAAIATVLYFTLRTIGKVWKGQFLCTSPLPCSRFRMSSLR